MSYLLANWTIQPLLLVLLLLTVVPYVRGWRRIHGWMPDFATGRRLALFLTGVALLVVAMLSPLYWWSNYLLSARSVQKVLLCMLAPPLLWLSAPLVMMRAGVPMTWRRRVRPLAAALRASDGMTAPLRQPVVTVMLFVSVFLLWHDPTVVGLSLRNNMLHVTSLWVLLVVALIYWRQIVGAGAPPGTGLGSTMSGWAAAAYLLAAEIPNMMAGVSIAFIATPLYAHYVDARSIIGPLPVTVQEDQMIAGAVVWVIGSLVYVSSIVLVVNRIFTREGADQPVPRRTWDIDEKFIAPGLEHRLTQPDYARANWGQD